MKLSSTVAFTIALSVVSVGTLALALHDTPAPIDLPPPQLRAGGYDNIITALHATQAATVPDGAMALSAGTDHAETLAPINAPPSMAETNRLLNLILIELIRQGDSTPDQPANCAPELPL